ncbi:T9SS type A sorting domain-containing protein [Seonamhaeicola maritimus]|uniref:T9SS type A sorting domain-containing protein n=1 Tax=Seonamhaeicola maritimus TaxID=2591822 RepID=A0A5C7GFX6_9FLAO|nr:T9SS type A sorting domain-containing protein [Seonamhaeicola maritimus]TXG36062.1 T9SS type A sorting domain-containing protein [Seonamhaeicola maritimus]
MKKITLIFLFAILPLLGVGQTTVSTHTFDSDENGFTAGSGATVGYDATNYFTATGSLSLTGAINKIGKVTFALDGAGDYTVTYKIRGAAPGQQIRTQYNYGGVNDFQDDDVNGTETGADGNNDWTSISYTYFLDGSLANASFQPKIKTDGAIYYIDDVTIVKEACVGYAVVVSDDGGGTAAIATVLPCYPMGTDVEVTATPNTACGFTFDQWEIDGNTFGISTNPYTYTVGTADTEIKALFTAPSPGDTNYDTDAELTLWTPSNGDSTVSVGTDDLTWTWTTVVTPKIIYGGCTIAPDSWTLNAAKIGYTNNSVNDVIRVRVLGSNGDQNYVPATEFMLTGGASGTAIVDLSSASGFLDYPAELELQVKKDDGTGTATNLNAQPGNIIIDFIEFYYDASLSAKDFNKVDFVMYPNPASKTVYLESAQRISKVSVFDITGKQVLTSSKLSNNALNVSALKSGLYLLQVEDANQSKGIKKLIIK